jgi:hypothetical protein
MLAGVVEEDLGAVGIEASRGKCVLDTDLLCEDVDRGPNPLQRHRARLKLESTNASAKPMNGTVAWRPRDAKQATRECVADSRESIASSRFHSRFRFEQIGPHHAPDNPSKHGPSRPT